MKLYTEEQVRKAYKDGNLDGFNNVSALDMCINSLTPIELPSDEEIHELATDGRDNHFDYNNGFIQGAIWLKEQILNQKNSNHQEVTSDTPSNYQRGWNAAQRGLLQNDAWGDTYTDNVNNRPSHEELDEWLRGWKAYRYSNEIAKNK